MKQQGHGFTVLELIIILAVAGLLGFIGYTVMNSNLPADEPAAINKQRSDLSKQNSEHKPTADPFPGWKTYHAKSAAVSLRHPSGWSVEDYSGVNLAQEADEEVQFVSAKDASGRVLRVNVYINADPGGETVKVHDSTRLDSGDNDRFLLLYGVQAASAVTNFALSPVDAKTSGNYKDIAFSLDDDAKTLVRISGGMGPVVQQNIAAYPKEHYLSHPKWDELVKILSSVEFD